jgi:aspartyl aminopeptidase
MSDHEYGQMRADAYWLTFTGGGPHLPIHVSARYNESVQEPVVITGAHTDTPTARWHPAWWPDDTGAEYRRHVVQRAVEACQEYWARVDVRVCDG